MPSEEQTPVTPPVDNTPVTPPDDFDFQDDNTPPPTVSTTPNTPVTPPSSSDDDDLDDNKRIATAVQTAVSPLVEKLEKLSPLIADREQAQVDKDWQQIVEKYPEAKGMESKVKRWATTPGSRYQGNLQGAFNDIAGADFYMKVGAKRAANANKQADEDKSAGGGSPAKNNPAPSNDSVHAKTSLVGKSAAEINQIVNNLKSTGRAAT